MRWAGRSPRVLVVLLALPAVLGSYAVTVLILIFFYAFLGQAWNIVGGYAGQLSAGHAAFVGIGGYTAAVLSIESGLTPWIGMFVGGALSRALLGTLDRLPRVPLRAPRLLLRAAHGGLRGGLPHRREQHRRGRRRLGLYITFTGNPRQFQFQDSRAYYYVALGLMLGATGIVGCSSGGASAPTWRRSARTRAPARRSA